MNKQTFGAYLVVKILSENRNDLGKYECVPNSWIKVKDNHDNTVVFGYPLEDRIHTRFRVIEYQPLDKKWPTIFGEVVFDTDCQEDAFRFIEAKTEYESDIHYHSKDTNKQDNKEVKLAPSRQAQPKRRPGRPRKQKLSDQETIPQNKYDGEELEKRLELEILEAQELIRTYTSDFDDQEAVISSTPKSSQNVKKTDATQIFPNETDNALEETLVCKKNAQKITQRPRRKSTRPIKYLESYLEFSDEEFDRSVKKPDDTQIVPNETDNASEEIPVNKKNAQKIMQRPRRKSTRPTKNRSDSYVELSDEDFDRSIKKQDDTQILSNATDNASEAINVNKKKTQKIMQKSRRKSTRLTKHRSDSYVEFSNENFDRSVKTPDDTQIVPNETDNDSEKIHLGKKNAQKIIQRPRRKSTRPIKYSDSYVEFSDEDFDRSVKKQDDTQILSNETDKASEETHVNKKNAQKIMQRSKRKSTRLTKNRSDSYVEFSDEDFDRSVKNKKQDDTQIFRNETDNDLEETHVNKKNTQKITQRPRRKSTRPTINLSESYVEFSDEDFDRSDDSDYTPEIVLPELPRPLEQSVAAVNQDINMSLLNDQVYSECYNFYVEFNESYQKSMSILDNAEDYLQNVISRHKDNVAAKAKQPSPLPTYQQPYANISPDMFSHPQPLLQERSTIREEDTRWTVRYPEPGLGIIELMPNTGVYVSETGLEKCKSRYVGTIKFTKGLLEEVFTDEALRNCSFTGTTRRKITPKPGLDPKARETFINYVLKYSKNKGWEKANLEIILSCIRNRLYSFSRTG